MLAIKFFNLKISTITSSPIFLLALSNNNTSSNKVFVLKSLPEIHLSFTALKDSQYSNFSCELSDTDMFNPSELLFTFGNSRLNF